MILRRAWAGSGPRVSGRARVALSCISYRSVRTKQAFTDPRKWVAKNAGCHRKKDRPGGGNQLTCETGIGRLEPEVP